MNFELYKPYKTRGGWKAICVDYNIDADPVFCHIKNNHREIKSHFRDGKSVSSDEYSIISEWHEPIKRTFWVVSDGTICLCFEFKENAKRHIKDAVGYDLFKIDYVQGATHYVAKGE